MDQPGDRVDHVLASWREARPDLDPKALGVIGRVLILAQRLQGSVEAALSVHDLTLGQFDILATLRRIGPRGALTPTQLLQSVVLSSGGMTSRLDKLESAGWIEREADPSDRRGIVVRLTAKGRKRIDLATATRFAEAQASLPKLPGKELQQLERTLRAWMLQCDT